MSETPAYDALKSTYDLAKSVGQMEGRQQMKDAVLAALKRASVPAEFLAAVITSVEKLDIRESGKNGTA